MAVRTPRSTSTQFEWLSGLDFPPAPSCTLEVVVTLAALVDQTMSHCDAELRLDSIGDERGRHLWTVPSMK